MTFRPRFGGDGRLRLPAQVRVTRRHSEEGPVGDVIGEFEAHDTDPFERNEDGLLLAESFGRFDLTRPRKAREWHLVHGVIDLFRLLPEDVPLLAVGVVPEVDVGEFHDQRQDIVEQQRLVRWHLRSLARLSQWLGASRGEPGPDQHWDPRWVQPALRHGALSNVLWLRGASSSEASISAEAQRYPRHEDVPSRRRPDADTFEGVSLSQRNDDWWRRAYAPWKRIETEGIPVLWVPSRSWKLHQRLDLSSDWSGLLELERRLMAPFIGLAAAQEVDFQYETVAGAGASTPSPGPIPRLPIVVHERRRWTSILLPIYLQLAEALRRISEGKRGATFCRECGEPFLTLDARRSMFCNDRERYRYSQRERRRRLSRPKPAHGVQR